METWRRAPSQTSQTENTAIARGALEVNRARRFTQEKPFWPRFGQPGNLAPRKHSYAPRSQTDQFIADVDIAEVLRKTIEPVDEAPVRKSGSKKHQRLRDDVVRVAMAVASVLGTTSCERWIVGDELAVNLPTPPAYQLQRARPEVYTALHGLSYAETEQVRDILTNASVAVARHHKNSDKWDMGGGVIIRTVNNPGVIGVITAGHLFMDDEGIGDVMTDTAMRRYDAVTLWLRSNSSPLPEYDGKTVAVALPPNATLRAGTMNDVAVVYPPFIPTNGQANFQQEHNSVALPLRQTRITESTRLFRIPFNKDVTNELIPVKYIGDYEGMYVTEDLLASNPNIARCGKGDSGGVIASADIRDGRLIIEVAGVMVARNANNQCFISPVFSGSPASDPATAMG